jgi:drug/metabolite transporter (DMT)-like permease
LGLAGAVFIIGPDVLGGLGLNALGQLAVLGAAMSYACAGIYGKRFKGISPYVTAAGQVTSTAVMMTPIALWVDRPWDLLPLRGTTWGALLAISLLSTAVAYTIYFRLLKTAGATNLLLVTLLVPVSALLLGAIVLGERVDARHLLGMVLIGLGLVAIDGRLVSSLQARLLRPGLEQ